MDNRDKDMQSQDKDLQGKGNNLQSGSKDSDGKSSGSSQGYGGANFNHIFDGDKPGKNQAGWDNSMYFPPVRNNPQNPKADNPQGQGSGASGGPNPQVGAPQAMPGGGFGGYKDDYGKSLYRKNAGSGKIVKAFVSIFIAIIFFGMGFLSGYFGAVTEEEKLTRWIMNTVAKNFYDGETTEFDFAKAIGKAMVNEVDEFSSFYTPEETLLLEQEDEGAFINSGLHLFDTDTIFSYEYAADLKDPGIDNTSLPFSPSAPNKVFALKVYGKSPAYEAGIRAGDVLTGIAGNSTDGMGIYEANSIISELFTKSSVVNLTFSRGAEVIEAALTRAEYTPQFSSYFDSNSAGYQDLPANAAVVTFEEFSKNADVQFAQNMLKFKSANKDVLILDMRTNFGGSLEILQNVAVHLISGDGGNSYNIPITAARYKTQSMYINSAVSSDTNGLAYANYGFKKIIVLANFYSASATELLISAMKDYGTITTLIGKRTYGKAVMQGRFSFGDYRMYLTIAKLYSVKNSELSYNKQGFSPDINVSYTLPGGGLDAQMQQAIIAASVPGVSQ